MLPNTEIFEFVSVSNRFCIFTAWNPKRGQFSFSLTICVLSSKQFDYCVYVSGTNILLGASTKIHISKLRHELKHDVL